SGLGLYICRRYIEAMGGKLWLAESTPEGSIFRFYLWCEDTPPLISPETGEVETIDKPDRPTEEHA
ncbi:MAG: ATP-binding protein, partial [Chloroflexota bacterium]|nr:ATP-binding protein [Chloroflexota bacterium]